MARVNCVTTAKNLSKLDGMSVDMFEQQRTIVLRNNSVGKPEIFDLPIRSPTSGDDLRKKSKPS